MKAKSRNTVLQQIRNAARLHSNPGICLYAQPRNTPMCTTTQKCSYAQTCNIHKQCTHNMHMSACVYTHREKTHTDKSSFDI